jgi:hypothetical protein
VRHLKAALLVVATAVVGVGTYAITSLFSAYPEAAPAPNLILVAAGALLWLVAFFLISRLPDRS